jgi:hypothetical protein
MKKKKKTKEALQMEEDNFIMGRVYTLDRKKFIKDTKHNYRLTYTKSKTSNITNLLIKNGIITEIKNEHNEEEKQDILNNNINIFKSNNKEHSKLFLENKGYRKNGTQSATYGGIVGFTYLKEDTKNLKEIILQVEKNLSNFCLEVGSELQELILHRDEKGQYHFHFIMKSFNKIGMSLQMAKGGINGSLLQDYLSKDMEQFGIKRGIRDSRKRHLTIREYQEMKDNIKQLENSKRRVKEQEEIINNQESQILEQEEIINNNKISLEDLRKGIVSSNATIKELEVILQEKNIELVELNKELLDITNNIKNVINNILELDKEQNYKDKVKKILDNFIKFINKEDIDQLNKLLNRAIKIEKSVIKTTRKLRPI